MSGHRKLESDIISTLKDILTPEKCIAPVHKLLSQLKLKGFLNDIQSDAVQDGFKAYLARSEHFYLVDKIDGANITKGYFAALSLATTPRGTRYAYKDILVGNAWEGGSLWDHMNFLLYMKSLGLLALGETATFMKFKGLPEYMVDWIASIYVENIALAPNPVKMGVPGKLIESCKALMSLLKVMRRLPSPIDGGTAATDLDEAIPSLRSEQVLKDIAESKTTDTDVINAESKTTDTDVINAEEKNLEEESAEIYLDKLDGNLLSFSEFVYFSNAAKKIANVIKPRASMEDGIIKERESTNFSALKTAIHKNTTFEFRRAVFFAINRLIDEAVARRSYMITKALVAFIRENCMVTNEEMLNFILENKMCSEDLLCTFDKITAENTRKYLREKMGKALIETRDGYTLNQILTNIHIEMLEVDLIVQCTRRVVFRFPQGISLNFVRKLVSKFSSHVLTDFSVDEEWFSSLVLKLRSMFFVPGNGEIYPIDHETTELPPNIQNVISTVLVNHIKQYGAIEYQRISILFRDDPNFENICELLPDLHVYVYSSFSEFVFISGAIRLARTNAFLSEWCHCTKARIRQEPCSKGSSSTEGHSITEVADGKAKSKTTQQQNKSTAEIHSVKQYLEKEVSGGKNATKSKVLTRLQAKLKAKLKADTDMKDAKEDFPANSSKSETKKIKPIEKNNSTSDMFESKPSEKEQKKKNPKSVPKTFGSLKSQVDRKSIFPGSYMASGRNEKLKEDKLQPKVESPLGNNYKKLGKEEAHRSSKKIPNVNKGLDNKTRNNECDRKTFVKKQTPFIKRYSEQPEPGAIVVEKASCLMKNSNVKANDANKNNATQISIGNQINKVENQKGKKNIDKYKSIENASNKECARNTPGAPRTTSSGHLQADSSYWNSGSMDVYSKFKKSTSQKAIGASKGERMSEKNICIRPPSPKTTGCKDPYNRFCRNTQIKFVRNCVVVYPQKRVVDEVTSFTSRPQSTLANNEPQKNQSTVLYSKTSNLKPLSQIFVKPFQSKRVIEEIPLLGNELNRQTYSQVLKQNSFPELCKSMDDRTQLDKHRKFSAVDKIGEELRMLSAITPKETLNRSPGTHNKNDSGSEEKTHKPISVKPKKSIQCNTFQNKILDSKCVPAKFPWNDCESEISNKTENDKFQPYPCYNIFGESHAFLQKYNEEKKLINQNNSNPYPFLQHSSSLWSQPLFSQQQHIKEKSNEPNYDIVNKEKAGNRIMKWQDPQKTSSESLSTIYARFENICNTHQGKTYGNDGQTAGRNADLGVNFGFSNYSNANKLPNINLSNESKALKPQLNIQRGHSTIDVNNQSWFEALQTDPLKIQQEEQAAYLSLSKCRRVWGPPGSVDNWVLIPASMGRKAETPDFHLDVKDHDSKNLPVLPQTKVNHTEAFPPLTTQYKYDADNPRSLSTVRAMPTEGVTGIKNSEFRRKSHGFF